MKRPSQARRAASLLAVVAALLGLSGCFKANQSVKVKADGSGSVVLHGELNKKAVAAIEKSLGDLGLGGTTPDLAAPFLPVDKTFPDGTKVRTADNAERSTLDASFDFSGSDEYKRKLRQINEAIDPGTGGGAFMSDDEGSILIRRVDDRMEVTLDVGSSTDAGDIDVSALRGLLDPETLPSVVVTITMPGSILNTNGKANGRTVTWDLLSNDAPPTLTASSKIAKPGLPAWALPAGAGLIVVLLLAMIGVALSKRSRAASAGPPVVPYQPVPTSQPAPPGTGTFFPAPSGLPPREAVGWPSSSPTEPTASPSGQPPSPGATWSSPPEAGVAPSPSGLPPREPVGQQPLASPPTPPPPPAAASPWAPAPPTPEAGGPAETGAGAPWAPGTPPPEAPTPEAVADPLPWRVPGAAGDPGTAAPAAEPVAPAAPTPTAPAAAAATPEPGWYSDPGGSGGVRYWDGQQWTQHTR
jgi:hypothetical protein